MPNAYAWGSSDNTYSVDGEKHTVTFNFAKPTNGGTITSIAIFPARTNGFNNEKSERGIDFYSKDPNKHQAYSGEYIFTAKDDGSATLEMSTLFRNGNIGAAEKYAAARSIFVYVTKDGTTTVYKTNVFRAETLVPPKTSGSVVLKYNEQLTPEKVQAAITAAANAATTRSDKMSVNDQIVAASKAKGVFTIVDGKSTQVADTLDGKLNVRSSDAYDAKQFAAINKETSAKGAKDKTYVAGAKTLNTYMVTDLGFKSGAIPLTVARYDDRIDKPIVEDPTNVSEDVKEEIKTKLAKINGITADKISFDGDNAVIHFDGVDEKDAPKIALRDLVLKKIAEDKITVPAADKAIFVYNPLAYNDAEIARIKKAIYEANKDNQELGLSAKDYENQISLSYLTGNLTATGDSNKGISNGQAENTITVKIKTDKAVAEFTSDVKARKLTKLPDIRKDYNVTWTKDKIEGRTTDEGLSWSEDGKTIIYRYDPTAAKEFDTNKILDLLKATAKDKNSGLRDLTGNEKLDHEGVDGKDKKSHVGYVIDKNGQPTTELSLGKMDGAYWKYSRNVDNSGVDLGNEESNAGSYSWDKDAKPVVVAAKQDKVYKARLFVLPYGLTMYRNIYMENGNQPWNTTKAINVIFVPQTNHKKQQLKDSIDQYKTTKIDGKDVPTQHEYYNASDDKKAAYDDALKKANDALKEAGDTEDSNLSEELKARIDNATIRLDKARAALDGAKTDKTKLEQDIKDQGTAAKGNTAASGTYETDKYKNVTEPAFLKDDGRTPDTKKNEAASAAKTAYDEALTEAEKVKADANATQKAVDEAKAKLDAARKELDKYSTNKDKLNAAIAEHGKVKDGRDAQGAQTLANADPAYQNATPGERTAYDNAVRKANELSKDPNASQKEVNDAITALEAAKAKLDAKATNKTKLAVAVQQTFDNPNPNDANGKKSTFYKNALGKKNSTDPNVTQEQKNAAEKAINDYDQALAKAKELLEDKNGTATQAQVDAAAQALIDAEDKLHNYSTDKNDLTKALADNIDGYLKPAYFNAFDKSLGTGADAEAAKKAFKEYNDAYHKAKELKKKFANTDPSQQPTDEDCKKAKEALEKARQVIDTYATDTSKLSAAFWNDLAIHNSPAYKNAQALVDKTNPTEDEKAQVANAKKIKKDYDDAVAKLHKAFSNTLDQDKDAHGNPFTKIPDAKGDPTSKNYLDGVQAHANGEPLDRDVTDILTAMNDAADQLKQFATKTDKLQESINKDTDTQKDPAYKNARDPHKLGTDGKEDTSGYDAIKEKAKAYDDALKDAKALMIKPDATQEDVNAALKKLDDARKALNDYKTNVDELKKNVEAQGSTDGPAVKEGTVTSDAYRNASDPHFLTPDGKPDTDKNAKAAAAKKAYDEALTKAQELLKKHDDKDTPQDAKPIQKEIDAALTTLNEKRKALDAYKTDTTKLDEEAKKSTAEGATVADADFEAKPEFKNAKAKTSNGVENTDVTAYKEALKKARALLEKFDANGKPKPGEKDIPSQKEVDEALKNLKEIKDKITKNYVTSPHDLQQEVDKSKDGDTDTSTDVFENTPEFKNATAKGDEAAKKALDEYNEKLKAAKGLLDAFDRTTGKPKDKLPQGMDKAPTQQELDKALKELQDAKKKITDGYKTDSSKLKSEADADDTFTKTPEYQNAQAKGDDASKQALEDYKKALEDANKVLGDKNATQADVDAALKKLQDAKSKLSDGYKTDKSDLTAEAGKDSDFTKTPEYKNAAGSPEAEAYKQALDEANKILGDANATQADVDAALKKLQDAKKKLADSHKTDKSGLVSEYVTDPDFRKSIPFIIGKAADLAEYQQALNDANSVLKDPNATQDQVDQALRRLRAAKQKLIDSYNRLINSGSGVGSGSDHDFGTDTDVNTGVGVNDVNNTSVNNVVDKGALQAEVDAALGDVSANANGVVADSNLVSEFNAALNYARSVLADANATQGQVDSALARLRAARAALRAGMLAARNSAGMNLKRGDVSGVNTGASSSVFAAFAAVFAGLGVAGAASKRRKHSAR